MRAPLGPVLASSLLVAGCAERGLVTTPATPPSAGAWTVVALAGALPALVLGVLATLPAWRVRRGARLAVTLLTVQTGALIVTTIVLSAVAIRSWQLVERPEEAAPASALLRLSRVDGDADLLALLLLFVLVAGGLLVALTALATRLAADTEPRGRAVAAALLTVELAGAGYAAVRLLLGDRGWPYLAPTLALPLLLAGVVTCWPRRGRAGPTTPGGVGEGAGDGLQLTHG